MRHSFYDDYSEGAHPDVLDAVVAAARGQQLGYGDDEWTRRAEERIGVALGIDVAVGEADRAVHLVSGGTQANIICLSAALRPHEAVVSADSGHINVHETGAIEATGHRIITVPSADGRLRPADIDAVVAQHTDEHMVRPRVVFVSQATETGLVYSGADLRALVDTAHRHEMLVYVDGARLAMALAAPEADMTLAGLVATGVDLAYLGGTKNGGLAGEAIVVVNPALRRDFRYLVKQRGALLAKGRLLGAQFARFFDTDDLWLRLGVAANDTASTLAAGLAARGVRLLQPRQVNQVFAILDKKVVAALAADYGFHIWQDHGADAQVIRLVCSWATPVAAVDSLLARLDDLLA